MSLIDYVKIVEHQTFSLLDKTFKKKEAITFEEFDNIVDDYLKMFKIVNNIITTEYIDPIKRNAETISMNDEVIKMSVGLKLKIKNNSTNYIIEKETQNKDKIKINSMKNINIKGEVLGQNEEDIEIKDETQKTSQIQLNESAIKLFLNDSTISDKYHRFTNLNMSKENYFYILMLDKSKDKNSYKTNYIFKDTDPDLLKYIYNDLKESNNLKKSIMVEILIEEETKIYYLMYIGKKQFNLAKYMTPYVTEELKDFSIENRFQIIENRGKTIFKEINQNHLKK